jgi:hypothetical protein
MRNPQATQRRTEANQRRTAERIDEYLGVQALLKTWESQTDEVQANNHSYILELRRRERNVKNYLQHRSGPDADI